MLLQALAAFVDVRRDELPLLEDGADPIRLVVTLPCRAGLEILYVTRSGVADASQLFETPDQLVRDADRWGAF